MSFPVDILNNYSHEDLENSAEDYLFDLRWGNPNAPEFFSLPDRRKVPISLTSVSFVPLYGEEQTHKVLALFAPWDSFTAVALYLADQWWSIDDIVRTSVPARQGLHQVKSVGERVVLYVLNRIIYRTQEMEKHETPFLCHGSSHYAKIMWKKGEAVGFYSVKPTGSVCSSLLHQKYKLTVLDTMFVRKKHRGKDSGLIMLEDFVDSFTEEPLGLRYPLSSFIVFSCVCSACKQYLEKYPGDKNLLWQVEGGGEWFQRKSIMSIVQKENLRTAAEASKKENKNLQAEDNFCQSAVPEASGPRTEVETQLSVGTQSVTSFLDYPNVTPVSIWTRSSHLKRQRLNRNRQEPGLETSQRDEENALQVSKSRPELLAHTSESSEDLVEVPKVDTVEKDEEIIVENDDQSVLEAEMRASPSEKQKPLNGEVAEETGKTSFVAEGETVNEVPSGESKLLSESQGKEPVTQFVPLSLEAPAKPSEDSESEKALNENDSEMLTEEVASVEKEGTEEQQETEKASTENAAASASKEEPSDNGLPNSVVSEAAEESASENLPSSLEDQNEEVGHNSQEAPAALSQGSSVMVELEGVSFQQPSGQEGQKMQLEEPSEESAEQTDHYTQTVAERAADSSSEEAEIEVPIVDRRNLRRKAKGYKGPPKKKGKPA
ncbi:F169A protein, partial [Erythrocercus mccallii]|nr:F169A protein [Erythrocercus mccallii]